MQVRILVLGLGAASAGLLLTPQATAQDALSCSDYPSQEVAQSVFVDADPSARAPMDRDGDGVACENLDGGTTSGSGSGSAGVLPQVADDRDCSDFTTQEEAQEFFEGAGPGDPHGLDPDGDGVACESVGATATAAPAATTTPDPAATAEPDVAGESLPNNGGPIETFTFAGLLCLLAGVVLIGWHRNMNAALAAIPRRVEQMPVLRAVIVRARRY